MAFMEFVYNKSYYSSIKIAPYEILYGRKCKPHLHWDDVGKKELLSPDLVQNPREKILLINKRLKAAQDKQKSWIARKGEIKF